jgi:hypothetical protein
VPCTADGADPEDATGGDRLFVCRLSLPAGGEGRVWVTDGPATGGRILHVGPVRLRDGGAANLRVVAKAPAADERRPAAPVSVVPTEALGPWDPRFGEEVEPPTDGRVVTEAFAVGRWPLPWRAGGVVGAVVLLALLLGRDAPRPIPPTLTGPWTFGAYLLGRGTAAAARWAPRMAALATLALCLLGGAALMAGALFSASDTTLLVGARAGATPGSLWSNATALDALAAGEPGRLLWSDAIYWPDGAELVPIFGNVVVPLFAAPFQAALGYPGYWNLFVLAAIAANGLAAFALARRVGVAPWGAALAGVAFAFSPPLLAEVAAGRQLQFVAFPLPLAIAAGLRALDTGRPRDGWLAGGALALACASYWFYGAFSAFVLAVLAVRRVAGDPAARPVLAEQGARVARMLAPVALLAVPLLVAANRGDLSTLSWGVLPERLAETDPDALATLLAHGVDPDALLMGEGTLARVVRGAAVVLVAYGLLSRRTRVWSALAVLSGVLALGAYLPPGQGPGQAWLTLPGAYVSAVVPFFSCLIHPDRWAILGALATAIVAGLVLERVGRVAAVATVIALPASAGLAPLPRFTLSVPDHYRQLGLPGAVAELPIGFREEALLYQPVHGRALFGGPGELAALEGDGRLRRAMATDSVLAWLAQAGAPLFAVPDLVARYEAGLRYVVVDVRRIDRLSSGPNAQAGLGEIAARVDTVLGPALYRSPDVVVYRVPAVVSVEDLAERMSAPAGP